MEQDAVILYVFIGIDLLHWYSLNYDNRFTVVFFLGILVPVWIAYDNGLALKAITLTNVDASLGHKEVNMFLHMFYEISFCLYHVY